MGLCQAAQAVRCAGRVSAMANDSMPPADGEVRLGPLLLPAGKRIFGHMAAEPLLWATSDPVPDVGQVWLALHDMRQETGLVPILLSGVSGSTHPPWRGDQLRPWDTGELEQCPLSEVDQLEPGEVLATSWADSLDLDNDDPDQLEVIAPFSLQFPGMAPAQAEELSRAERANALTWFRPARVGLVPARRPADVLALVGFNGTVNRYQTPAQFTAVLRSWEERFGSVLVEVGFDHIRLLVQRPPRTRQAAEAVAAEHWAMCDEFWPTGPPDYALTTVGEIAAYIKDAPYWGFWLD